MAVQRVDYAVDEATSFAHVSTSFVHVSKPFARVAAPCAHVAAPFLHVSTPFAHLSMPFVPVSTPFVPVSTPFVRFPVDDREAASATPYLLADVALLLIPQVARSLSPQPAAASFLLEAKKKGFFSFDEYPPVWRMAKLAVIRR